MADDGRHDSNNRAAVIIRTADGILVGHTPNEARDKNGWDFPKGHIAEGEVPEDGAVRETQEETGLSLDTEKLVFLGKHTYHSGLVYLYGYDMPNFTYADLASLECKSMFDWASYADGKIIMKNTAWPKDAIHKKYPEITEFALIQPEEVEDTIYYGLYQALTPASKKWISGESDIELTDKDIRTSLPTPIYKPKPRISFEDIIVNSDDYVVTDDMDEQENLYRRELDDIDYDRMLFDTDYEHYQGPEFEIDYDDNRDQDDYGFDIF